MSAYGKVFVKERRNEEGNMVQVTIPEHLDVIAEMEMDGAQAHFQFSAVTGLSPSMKLCLYGTEDTIHVDVADNTLRAGKQGEEGLQKIEIPQAPLPALPNGWRVEHEFITAIRGTEAISNTTFETGLRYMEFTEAVTRSLQRGGSVVEVNTALPRLPAAAL